MADKGILKHIIAELRVHSPFTLFGALLGVVFMLAFGRLLDHQASLTLFYIFHPAHVVLSAMVTTALFRLYSPKTHLLTVVLIGYIGAVGVATLSDSLVPYLGERLLGMHVEAHPDGDQDDHIEHSDDCHSGHMHIGFIEKWYIVNPAALLGILIAWAWPRTKLPHAGHVLLSVWASLFHIIMAAGGSISTFQIAGIFVFLFMAVLVPCCVSDIIFPLLFIPKRNRPQSHCH